MTTNFTGTNAAETLTGDGQANIIDGKRGDDRLEGKGGNDTYKFGRGYGVDTIDDSGGMADKILFGSGITKDNLIAGRNDNDLVIGLKPDTGKSRSLDNLPDRLILTDWFVSPGGRIEIIEFADDINGESTLKGINGFLELFSTIKKDTLNGIGLEQGFTFDGGINADTITGSVHKDFLYGSNGNDIIHGRYGDDEIFGGNGEDTIHGEHGNDIIEGNNSSDTIHGGSGNDTIKGDNGADILNGNEDNDFIEGGAGADSIDGGSGIDTASYETSSAGVNINLKYGTATGGHANGDTLTNIENLTGSSHADNLTGDVNANVLDGKAGDDSLQGGQGDDTYMFGYGYGIDTITDAGGRQDKILFGKEIKRENAPDKPDITKENLVVKQVGYDLQIGLNENSDVAVEIDSLADKIILKNWFGFANNNNASGDARIEILEFADGTRLEGSTGENSILSLLTSENDDEFDWEKNDQGFTFYAGDGNDEIRGGSASDNLHGDGDDDVLEGRGGGDTLNGGEGSDTASYASSDAGVTVNLANGTAQGGDAARDTLNSIENLTGSAYGDTLTGNGKENVLDGKGGADTLRGGSGNDTYIFDYGYGIDTIIETQVDNDKILFGKEIEKENLVIDRIDDDLVIGLNRDKKNKIALADLTDKLILRDWFTSSNKRIETLEFTNGDRPLVVGDIITFFATDGDDNFAWQQNDTGFTFDGGKGNDTITGGTSTDILKGGANDDTLDGRGGIDRLEGGGGNDTYKFGFGYGHDTIVDSGGRADKILFNTGVSIENLVVRRVENSLWIALKDEASDSISFDNLPDRIILTDWFTSTNNQVGNKKRIETLEFANGDTLNINGIIGLFATSGDDELDWSENETGFTFNGGDGDDSITVGAGADTINGGDGNDTASYAGSDAAVTIKLTNGSAFNEDDDEDNERSIYGGYAENDRLTSIENIIGSDYNDTLTGDDNDYIFEGGAGADTITGGGGDNTASYASSDAGVTVKLTDGNSFNEEGEEGNDRSIYGGHAENDRLINIKNLIGSAYNDTLKGDGNDNTFEGGAGADNINGGEGDDTVSYASSNAGVYVNLSNNNIHSLSIYGGHAEGDTLTNIRHLIGSAHNDTLTASDTEWSSLEGGAGADIIDGGFYRYYQRDEASYASSDSRVIVNLETGQASGGHAEGDTLIAISNLRGSSFDDILTGNFRLNSIRGGDGNDTIYGNGGKDWLFGGSGNDTIHVHGSSNTLFGDEGADRFEFVGDSYENTIKDFEYNIDVISFENHDDVNSFDDLDEIMPENNTTTISTNGRVIITLENVSVIFNAEDFIF